MNEVRPEWLLEWINYKKYGSVYDEIRETIEEIYKYIDGFLINKELSSSYRIEDVDLTEWFNILWDLERIKLLSEKERKELQKILQRELEARLGKTLQELLDQEKQDELEHLDFSEIDKWLYSEVEEEKINAAVLQCKTEILDEIKKNLDAF